MNPFKYQIVAKILQEEDEEVLLQLSRGPLQETIHLPKRLLPPEIQKGEEFILNFQDTETAKKGETESLKALLKELLS